MILVFIMLFFVCSGLHEFTVSVQKSSGRFEILEGGATVVTGIVKQHSRDFESHKADPVALKHSEVKDSDEVPLQSREIYKELRLRGYNYSGLFRGLESSNSSGNFEMRVSV